MERTLEVLLTLGISKTRKWCANCEKETEHEIKTGDGCVAKICIPCKVNRYIYEANRD